MNYNSQRTTFHAARTDGFGERLRAILNSMVLAERLNGYFSFSWQRAIIDASVRDLDEIQKHHVIADARETFSKDFIRDHFHEGHGNRLKWKALREKFDTLEELGRSISGNPYIAVNSLDLSEVLLNADEIFPAHDFTRAYNKIIFNDTLEWAKELANAISIHGNAVGIHLRAGDIVYGSYRYSDNLTGKVIPLPLAINLITRQREEGKTVLLFGQDKALCSYLAERYGAIQVSSLIDGRNFDEMQSAIFDITLMARCNRIFSGNSGFALLAGKISGAECIAPRKIFHPREIISLTESCIELTGTDPRVSDLQRSFSYLYAIVQATKALTADQKLKFIERSIAYDPRNDFLKILKASILFEMNDNEGAESVLEGILGSIEDGAKELEESEFFHLLTAKRPGMPGVLRLENQYPALRGLADAGFPAAALCTGFMERSLGKLGELSTRREVVRGAAKAGNIYDHVMRNHLLEV